MKKRILMFSTVLLLFGGLSLNFNANAGYPCSGDRIPTYKKKLIGELICVQGGNDCIKCKKSIA